MGMQEGLGGANYEEYVADSPEITGRAPDF